VLSAASGVSVAYVFLDLMPDLAEQQRLIDQAGLFSFLDRHVYILALVGLTVSLWVETASRESRRRRRALGEPDETGTATFWLSMVSFAVLNAAIGYAVASPNDQAVEPLWMFALAMALHFAANDHSLVEHHGERYQRLGRWLLIAGLLGGWLVGILPSVDIRPDLLALVLSYIAGGTIMNILRHELPDTDRSSDVVAFASAAAVYGVLLLSIASRAQAQAPDVGGSKERAEPEEVSGQDEERLNGIELGFTHAFQLLRTSPSEAEAGRSENLVGFVIGYERTLIPNRLVLVVAKPFHFTRDRFDSPIELFLKVNFPKGHWEPYVGAGMSGNLRTFSGELEQEEGRRVEYTFGVGAIAGFVYLFTPQWGVTVEVGYSYFVNGLAQHAITDSVAGVFRF